MKTVISKDGTNIAYDKIGRGPTLVMVLGALNTRKSGAKLAKLLAEDFTVINYDRRGRGNSTDTAPYAPEREVEDLAAVINDVGGPVYLYGHSSGAAVVLKTAAKLPKQVKRLAIYEAPYVSTRVGIKASNHYYQQLKKLLMAGQTDEAVASFIGHVGVSANQIAALKRLPIWKGLVALAPTLAYDSGMLGKGHALPGALLKKITVPSLVMHGGAGSLSMRDTARAISRAIAKAQLLTVEKQNHGVHPNVMAPLLTRFFKRQALRRRH